MHWNPGLRRPSTASLRRSTKSPASPAEATVDGSSYYVHLLALSISALISISVPVEAQSPAPLGGAVVDRAGSAIPGARVTVTTTDGIVAQVTTTDGTGAFSLRGLEPGTYTVLIELNLFEPSSQTVTVPASGSATPLRFVLDAGGFAETVVVTARRAETRARGNPAEG